MESFFCAIQACIDKEFLKKLREKYKDHINTWTKPAKQAFDNLIEAPKAHMKVQEFKEKCVGDIPDSSPIDKIVMQVMRDAYIDAVFKNKDFVEMCKKFPLFQDTHVDECEMENCFMEF